MLRSNVAIIGQGYVGFPLAMHAWRAGWNVIGIDVSSDVVSTVAAGKSHIEDVSNDDVREALDSGTYKITDDFGSVSNCDVCVICVPTPVDQHNLPDLTYLDSAIRKVAHHLKKEALLISESTSFPGTVTELIQPILEELRLDKGVEIDIVSAPERIDPRNKSFNIKNTPRVVGGLTDKGTSRAKAFYETFCDTVHEVSSPAVAEFAKLLENTFRQVNIALVNQLVPFANSIGVDIREVISASGTKPYGFMSFYPGAGVGGHCIPVDPLYLLWRARKENLELKFIDEADRVNSQMPIYVVDRLLAKIPTKKKGSIVILGVAYKQGISDIRETPAKLVADELSSRGFNPLWCDPLVEKFYDFSEYQRDTVEAAVIVTAQSNLPVDQLSAAGVPILDCTGVFKGMEGVEQL